MWGHACVAVAIIASVASYICERSELYVRVGWRISLVYIYIYIYIYIYLYPWVDHLVPRGPRVTRNAQTSDRPVEVQFFFFFLCHQKYNNVVLLYKQYKKGK